MAYQCPHCGEEYDIALFQFGNKVICSCGQIIDASQPRIIEAEEPPDSGRGNIGQNSRG